MSYEWVNIHFPDSHAFGTYTFCKHFQLLPLDQGKESVVIHFIKEHPLIFFFFENNIHSSSIHSTSTAQRSMAFTLLIQQDCCIFLLRQGIDNDRRTVCLSLISDLPPLAYFFSLLFAKTLMMWSWCTPLNSNKFSIELILFFVMNL